MTSDDQWPFASHERLLRALSEQEEQALSAAEATELAETVARLAAWQAPTPTPSDVRLLLERLEPLLPTAPAQVERVATRRAQASWLWLLALRQIRLIPQTLWLGSALGLVCLTLFGLVAPFQSSASALLLLAPLIAASGAAFLHGREADPALELTLTTPTSARLILLARVALVLGFDVLLMLAGSALVAAAHSQSAASLLALWLGPALLLSSATLCLSLLSGPVVAIASAVAIWGAQLIAVSAGFSLALALSFARSVTWLTPPLALGLTCIFLVIALLCAPYQRRLA